MTDNEIIKALECCKKHEEDCTKCPYSDSCFGSMVIPFFLPELLNVFIRQKAEIERLRRAHVKEAKRSYETDEKIQRLSTIMQGIDKIKNKAIKEFAARLKASVILDNTGEVYLEYNAIDYDYLVEEIDSLVKEMTEETK